MPSSGYRKTTADFGQMSKDLQSAAASFGKMTSAAGLFINMVKSFADFENKIIRVNALAGGTAKNMKELADAARTIALKTAYNATEVAEAMTILAQAGFSTKETIESIPEVLKLAQASMEDINLVSDLVVSTLRTFNLTVDESSRVVNAFAAANANSQANVGKLAFSLRQVGPVASEFGLSLEETTAALSVLYNRGLRGEQAGTALRNIIVRLIKPTKELNDVFYDLGLSMRDADGRFSLQHLLGQLRNSGITDEQLTKMFGREALAGAKVLIGATGGEWDKMTEKITGTNEATRQAEKQLESLTNQLGLAKKAVGDLLISAGGALAPAIKDFTAFVNRLSLWLNNLDDSAKESISTFLKWGGVIVGLKAGLSGTLDFLKRFKASWLEVTSTIQKASKVISLAFSDKTMTKTELIRMNEIGKAGGKDWYANMLEYYKSVTDGKKISMVAANDIKNMSVAEIEALKATKSLSAAWKVLTTNIKGFITAYGPLALILSGAALAIKGIKDLFSTQEPLTEEDKKRLFPELTALEEQILKTDRLATNTLPEVIKKLQAFNEELKGLNNLKEAGNPFAILNEATMGWSQDAKSVATKRLRSQLQNWLMEGVTPTKYEMAQALRASKLPTELADALLQVFNEQKGEYSRIFGGAYEISGKMVDTVFVNQFSAYQKEIENLVRDRKAAIESIVKENLLDINKLESLLIKDPMNTSEEKKDAFIRAWIYASTHIAIPETEDVSNYLKRNKIVLNMLRDSLTPEKIEDSFSRMKALPEILPDYLQGKVDMDIAVQIHTDDKQLKEDLNKAVTETAALVSQQSAVKNLKATYEGLINDYRKKWELTNQEIFREINVKELDLKIDKLKTDNYNAQVSLLKQIYKESQQLEGLDIKTKEYLDKQTGILSENGALEIKRLVSASKLNDAQKAMVYSLVEQMQLNGLILKQNIKELEQEEKQYDLVEGRLNRIKAYKEWLDSTINRRDSDATRDVTWENFKEGVHTGVYSIEQEIDSVYEMGKNGMKGFADYMTDSMNNVVDAWGKGWGAMKDALKNTLADMLKDLAHYFMKQSMYMLASKVGGFFGGSVAPSAAPGENIPPVPTVRPWSANGSAWVNGMQTFANGGIVTNPTLFNHRGGRGLMGEAGPEAIMPLRRDSQGRLGVSVAGGSTLNYAPSFNINMTTGQMDSETSRRNTNRMTKELDNKVKNAVLLVLAKEKRPGGLLYGR